MNQKILNYLFIVIAILCIALLLIKIDSHINVTCDCYESEDKDSIDIGYVGGKDSRKIEEYLTFYKRALNQLFIEFSTVEIEADNVDPFAYALLNEFEYDKSESWDAYIYDVN